MDAILVDTKQTGFECIKYFCDQCIGFATEALLIQKSNGNMVDAIQSLHFLANLHLHQHQFKSSLSYYSKVLQLECSRYGYYSDEMAKTLNCVGVVQSLQNEFALAMESQHEALHILKLCHGKDS